MQLSTLGFQYLQDALENRSFKDRQYSKWTKYLSKNISKETQLVHAVSRHKGPDDQKAINAPKCAYVGVQWINFGIYALKIDVLAPLALSFLVEQGQDEPMSHQPLNFLRSFGKFN